MVSLVSITESQLSLNTQDFGAYRSFIIYRDLNPLHNVISEREYKDKYYKGLIPLGVKYAEVSSINWTGTYNVHVDFIVISNPVQSIELAHLYMSIL